MPDPDLKLWQFDTSGRISAAIQAEYLRYLTEYAREVGPLTEATAFSLRRFMIDRSDRWCPSTLLIARRAFRSFFGWAVGAGVMAENPALGLPAVRVPEVAVRVADEGIRAQLLAACRDERDRAVIAVIFGSGARRSEVAALRVTDVDVAVGTIAIAKSKSGRPRIAPIDRPAREALTAWLAVRSAPTTDALWTTARGTPLSPSGLKIALRRCAERADVVWSPHDSRRAWATEWMRRGGSEVGLMAAAGWSSTSMIQRYTRNARQELALLEARRLFG